MSGVKDIQQLKDVVLLVAKVVNGFQAALADGKIGLTDAGLLLGLVEPTVSAVAGITEIPAELEDMQPEEAAELVNAVMAELAVVDVKARAIVSASLDLLTSSVPKVMTLVNAIKA